MKNRALRHTRLTLLSGAVLVTALVAGLAAFQPWKLWTHSYVDEALPAATVPASRAVVDPVPSNRRPSSTRPPITRPSSASSAARTVILRSGQFVSGEHRTSGRALLLRLADGRFVVRLEDLDTSDGPDLHVVLSAAPSGSGSVGEHVRLGRLKATSGNQNYFVPTGADAQRFLSVAVWCRRFDAVFGSAPLQRT